MAIVSEFVGTNWALWLDYSNFPTTMALENRVHTIGSLSMRVGANWALHMIPKLGVSFVTLHILGLHLKLLLMNLGSVKPMHTL